MGRRKCMQSFGMAIRGKEINRKQNGLQLKKTDVMACAAFVYFRLGEVAKFCEKTNKISSFLYFAVYFLRGCKNITL
jgi:hypothetical protein